MTPEDWLRRNLKEVFELPVEAIDWLLMLWGAIQVFDDVADGDTVTRPDLDAAIWNTLVAMPRNPFFVVHAATLAPVMAASILKWQASDRAEIAGAPTAMSYAWRAGYYDVVLMAVQCCKGVEFATNNAHHVMALYGEHLGDYLKEFEHA